MLHIYHSKDGKLWRNGVLCFRKLKSLVPLRNPSRAKRCWQRIQRRRVWVLGGEEWCCWRERGFIYSSKILSAGLYQIDTWQSNNRRKTNVASYIQESYIPKRFKDKSKMRNEYICPPELRNGQGPGLLRRGGGLTERAEEQVLSDSRWSTQIKGVPGNCSPPGKTPFSIFLGNEQRGWCFSWGRRVSAAFGSGWPTCPDGTCWGCSFWTPSRSCWQASFSSISSLGIFVGIRCRKHHMAYVLDFSHPVQWKCLLA